jgi:hypothetical protein
MVTRATKAKPVRKKKGLTAKQESERERLETLIGQNEERLTAGNTAGGQPLTEKQIETTRQIIRTQRERLQELEALVD